MNKITLSLISAISLSMASPTQSFDLGIQASKGNDAQSTSTYSAKYQYSNTFSYIKVDFVAEAISGKSKGLVNDEKYSIDLNAEKLFYNNWLGYYKIGWLKDRKKLKIDSKLTLGIGAGKSIIKNDKRQLDLKLGVASVNSRSYSSEHYNSYAGLEESVNYTCNIRDGVKLLANASSIQSFSDFSKEYEIKGKVALEVAISKDTTMSFEYGKDFFHTKDSSTYTDRVLVKLGYKF